MNEFKFRCYDKKLGAYIDDFVVHGGRACENDYGSMIGVPWWILEQSTGWIDRNNVEIYQNDVVNLDINHFGIVKTIVKWHDHRGCWYFESPKENYFMGYDVLINHVEVIGNVHKGETV